jgi:hypothetical protein
MDNLDSIDNYNKEYNNFITIRKMYTKNNLPVVILKDWSELNNNLENKLKEWYIEHINKTSIDNIFERLTFKYWLNT